VHTKQSGLIAIGIRLPAVHAQSFLNRADQILRQIRRVITNVALIKTNPAAPVRVIGKRFGPLPLL